MSAAMRVTLMRCSMYCGELCCLRPTPVTSCTSSPTSYLILSMMFRPLMAGKSTSNVSFACIAPNSQFRE